MVSLTAGDTVELQGNFRAADGYFAADQTSFWGADLLPGSSVAEIPRRLEAWLFVPLPGAGP
jgi:hypothetical protein